MSMPRRSKEPTLEQWIHDYTEAKQAFMSIGQIYEKLFENQVDVVGKLHTVYCDYLEINDEVHANQKRVQALYAFEQELLTEKDQRIEIARTQLNAVQSQIQLRLRSLEQINGLKQPEQDVKIQEFKENNLLFISVLDTFLTRFTLKIELQQAAFYKRVGSAFNDAAPPPTTTEARHIWFEHFESVMLAVEAMKHIVPHVGETYARLEKPAAGGYLPSFSKLTDKFKTEAREPVFSDHRMGFFYRYGLHPNDEHRHPEIRIAAYDFNATDDNDLSFKRGDELTIIDKGTKDDPNWWFAELDGKKGLIPENYLVKEDDEGYKLEDNAADTRQILHDEPENGRGEKDQEGQEGQEGQEATEGAEGAEEAKEVKEAKEGDEDELTKSANDLNIDDEEFGESHAPKMPPRPHHEDHPELAPLSLPNNTPPELPPHSSPSKSNDELPKLPKRPSAGPESPSEGHEESSENMPKLPKRPIKPTEPVPVPVPESEPVKPSEPVPEPEPVAQTIAPLHVKSPSEDLHKPAEPTPSIPAESKPTEIANETETKTKAEPEPTKSEPTKVEPTKVESEPTKTLESEPEPKETESTKSIEHAPAEHAPTKPVEHVEPTEPAEPVEPKADDDDGLL